MRPPVDAAYALRIAENERDTVEKGAEEKVGEKEGRWSSLINSKLTVSNLFQTRKQSKRPPPPSSLDFWSNGISRRQRPSRAKNLPFVN